MRDRKLLNIELGRVSAQQYKELPESGLTFKVDKIWLCGISAVPPSAEIHKSALGAEDSVAWEHADDTLEAVRILREQGYTVVSVEQTVRSVSLDAFRPEPGRKYALIFGNEVDGVRQDVVDASDFSLEIPQFGTKHSLNVSVAAGIIIWHFAKNLQAK